MHLNYTLKKILIFPVLIMTLVIFVGNARAEKIHSDNNEYSKNNINVSGNGGSTLSSQNVSSFVTKAMWNSNPKGWSWEDSKVITGDFDGDNIDDVAIFYNKRDKREAQVYVFLGCYCSPVLWWTSGPGNWDGDGSMVSSGDYNDDGKDDISILYGYKTERDVRVFVLTANESSFNSPSVWWHAGPGNWDWDGSKLVSGDFNGDNKDDIAVLYGYQVERDVRAFVFPSTGSKLSGSQIWWQAGAGNWDWDGSKLTVGDFNNDGRDDLAILYGYKVERDVRAFVFPSTGSKLSGSQIWWQAGAGNWDWDGSKLLSGDYNGDGKSDLAMFYGYAGSTSRIFVLPTSNNKFNSPGVWWFSGIGNWNGSASKVASGRFNGSGDDQVAVFYNYGGVESGLWKFE